MQVTMTPLEIIGLKDDLPALLHALQRLGCVQIDHLRDSPGSFARPLTVDHATLRTQEELKLTATKVDALLAHFQQLAPTQKPGKPDAKSPPPMEDSLARIRATMAELTPQVQALVARRAELQDELDALPRYQATLRKLLPIVPSSAGQSGNVSIGVLVSRTHGEVLHLLSQQVTDLSQGRAEVTTGDVDEATRAMLLVFPAEFTAAIESLLGQKDVTRLRLPSGLAGDSPEDALATLQHRMASIPTEIAGIEQEIARLASRWASTLAAYRSALRDQVEAINVLDLLGETDRAFVLRGWAPAGKLEQIRAAILETAGEMALVRPLPLVPELEKRAPIILENAPPAQPFESLVKLLSLPRYSELDPSKLMALFMPIFFGMMLGDVGYGLILLMLCLVARRRLSGKTTQDILMVLTFGAGWTILFGILFGEAFGNLGEQLGMHALWFERASPQHVSGLLVMTLTVGAVHIALGLIIGVWEAFRERSRNHLLERGGMLIGLVGLFAIVGALTDLLPDGLMGPATATLVLGIVVLSVPLGWVGLLLGPVEFIGLIGNVLSYLRIAAIGLASIYLAQVANEMAGKIGNLIVGAIVAVLLHALNLLMGAFSPTIHSLRLHYVEFFRKFYLGGGRAYQPFRSHLEE